MEEMRDKVDDDEDAETNILWNQTKKDIILKDLQDVIGISAIGKPLDLQGYREKSISFQLDPPPVKRTAIERNCKNFLDDLKCDSGDCPGSVVQVNYDGTNPKCTNHQDENVDLPVSFIVVSISHRNTRVLYEFNNA